MDPESKEFLLFLLNISLVDSIYTHENKKLPPEFVQHPVSLYVEKPHIVKPFLSREPVRESQYVTPWDVGVEWLLGDGPRDRVFGEGDYFTELLKKHDHIEEVRRKIVNSILDYGEDNVIDEGKDSYGLNGIEGVGKYIKDYSTLFTGGLFGNLAVTYLGSYKLNWKIIAKDYKKNTVTIEFTVFNSSTIGSGTRPPVIGYTDLYKENVQDPLNRFFETGPLSKTTQTFIWTETLEVK